MFERFSYLWVPVCLFQVAVGQRKAWVMVLWAARGEERREAVEVCPWVWV